MISKISRVPNKKGQTQAERTEHTQKILIRATIELLKTKRYIGLRTADVAELAGVSRGAQTHHFPTKDALVLKALEMTFQDSFNAAKKRINLAANNPQDSVNLLLEDSVDVFLGDEFLLALDLMMVDQESELGTAVKKLALQYRKPVEEEWIAAFVDAGFDAGRAGTVVRLTFATARGFGIRKLIGESMDDISHWLSSWSEIANNLLLNPVEK